jgi:hypothetical protein
MGDVRNPFIHTGQGIVYRRDANRHARAVMMTTTRRMRRFIPEIMKGPCV